MPIEKLKSIDKWLTDHTEIQQPEELADGPEMQQLQELILRSDDLPVNVHIYFFTNVWFFKGDAYRANFKQNYTDEQIRLLILEFFDKERKKFEKLMHLYKSEPSDIKATHKRERIPEEVRIEVWRRDGGKCAHCGSREKLEYDHIVPISKGGSNTARNIELLCEVCNRKKGDRIE